MACTISALVMAASDETTRECGRYSSCKLGVAFDRFRRRNAVPCHHFGRRCGCQLRGAAANELLLRDERGDVPVAEREERGERRREPVARLDRRDGAAERKKAERDLRHRQVGALVITNGAVALLRRARSEERRVGK